MTNIVKIIIATFLFGCLLKMPYGYFQFVRIATCIGFIWLANEYKAIPLALICCVGAVILFNPIFKVHFSRILWNTMDAIVGGLLIVWSIGEFVYLHYGKRSKKENSTGSL